MKPGFCMHVFSIHVHLYIVYEIEQAVSGRVGPDPWVDTGLQPVFEML